MTPEDEFLFEDTNTAERPTVDFRSTKERSLNEPQATAHPPAHLADPHVVILASAGTGKTFQLTNRYLTLLRSGSPDRILASTFTRKAAGEILDRILVRLAISITDDRELSQLQQFVGQPPITRDECLTLLQQLTRQLHRVQISTLDALFSKLASSHAFELGFPPGWRMIEDVEAGRLTDRAIDAVLRQAGRQDARRLMHLLSKGENSRRVHDLIRETVQTFSPPYLITQEADWNRIPDLPLLSDLELSGAIALFESLRVADKRVTKAVEKNQGQARTGDWAGFLSDGLPLRLVKGDTTYYNKDLPADLMAAYAPLVHHAKALFYKVWASQTRGTWETLDRVHTELTRLKNEERLLDFGDISQRLAEQMGVRAVNDVAFRLDANIDHLLLDEFQDTSLIQWQILRPFAEATTAPRHVGCSPRESDATDEPQRTFFCVGDRKQAIYGWRGGEAAIFDTIQTEFPMLQQRPLDTSRRSSPPIIEAVNQAFSSLSGTTDFESLSEVISHWCQVFPSHDTALKSMPGYVQMEIADEVEIGSVGLSPRENEISNDVSAQAHATKNAKPTKADLSDLVLERTADRIAEYARTAPSATIAVLFRGNSAIRLLANKLRKRELDFSEEGGTLITDSAAVQLLLSLLKIADHPGDRVARFHVATSPLAEIHQLGRWDDDATAIALSQHLRSRLLNDGYLPTLQRWVLQLGSVATDHDRSRLKQLIELAEGYQATTRPRDFIRLVETRKVENTTPARIQLMTVHKSKGLQFDIVFLSDLDGALVQPPKYLTAKPAEAAPPDRVLVYRAKDLREILPPELQLAYEQTQATDLTGSLCVLYVAMTRAVHALHIILPAKESKTVPKTLAGLLMAGLGGGQAATPRSTLYDTGNPLWYESCPALLRAPPPSASDTSMVSIEFAPLTGGRRRGMERVVPSQIADKATHVKLSAILQKEKSTGIDRGALFHAWLERIAWLDEKPFTDEELRQVATAKLATHLDVDRCITQFRSLIQRPNIAKVLSRSAYQSAREMSFSASVQAELARGVCEPDLHQERRFSVIDAGQLLSGAIDRLVLIRQAGQVIAADILDFKTDALPEGDGAALQEIAAAYRDQMRSYAKAVGRMYRLSPDRISTRLVLLSIGQVIPVGGEPVL